MKISALVKELEGIKEKHGNLDVFFGRPLYRIYCVRAMSRDDYYIKRGEKASYVQLESF